MNIIRDDYNSIGKNKKNNKIITVIIVAMVILAIIAGALLLVLNNLKKQQFKFYIDTVSYNMQEDIFFEIEDVRYVKVKAIANAVGYEYNNGEYNNPYQEDKSKCYVKSENEIASFIAGSNKIYKVLLKETPTYSPNNASSSTSKNNTDTSTSTNQTGTVEDINDEQVNAVKTEQFTNIEYYEFENEVKLIDGEIYATEEAIRIGFNIEFKYKPANNQVEILTLPYLMKTYSSKYSSMAVGFDCGFSNEKLVLYDMAVIKNSTGEYGVNKISTGESILGTKYANIKFIESSLNFIVTTQEGKQGISSLTETKISPQYDELKQIDKDLDLYVVKDDNKYGVIDGTGETIIHIEYEQIGLDTSVYVNNNIENQYIIYEKYIPVKRDGKWGLKDVEGKTKLSIEYDAFGCVAGPSITTTENNLLLVPEVQGIVVHKKGLYGLMNPEGTKLVPASLNEMYKVTNAGKNTYYMTYNEEKINILDWIEAKQNRE